MSEQNSPLQRFSGGDGGLIYDMRGPWVRFEDHLKALNTERSLADDRVEQAEKEAAKRPSTSEPPSPTNADFHPARRQLFEAVKALRALGWSDGDIVFGAELDPEQPTSSFSQPPQGGDQR